MDKSLKMKKAARNTRAQNIKRIAKKIILFPGELCKKLWRFICRICKAFWNWLKSINIVGMINLALLVAIIVLFTSLIINFKQCNNQNTKLANAGKSQVVDTRKVVQRNNKLAAKKVPTLPVAVNAKTGIKPQIKTIGVKKPVVVKQISLPAAKLPQQNLTGDVIVDLYPSAPVLSNGVKIQGNIIAMEQCDLFANLSKYDMILQDRVTDSYNSNYCYRCDIKMVDSSKEFFEINGWKLNYISFGGNWYGQWGVCNIEDRYGKKYKIDGCSQQWYYQHFISMLTTCLYNFMSFAKTNICVDYIKLSETISNIDKLGDYLRLYKEF